MVSIFENLDNQFVTEVEETIHKWNLSKTNKQGFLDLREYYNKNLDLLDDRKKSVILYCLITHAFNYQIAFNSKGEYNMPSGAGRSYFSPQLKDKLINYVSRKQSINISFYAKDFVDFDFALFKLNNNSLIYVDPPYLITDGAYNSRDYFCRWSEDYEQKLLALLGYIDNCGYKFALSNVLEHKGKVNNILKEWSKQYNTHFLIKDYKNCNYHTKDKTAGSSVEVLITNY